VGSSRINSGSGIQIIGSECMSFTWYINPGSQSEDGLHPDTGYHNYGNLIINRTISDGDVVNFVNNGIADDSSSTLFNISNEITLQSWPSNTAKPTWKPAKEISIIPVNDGSSFTMLGLSILGTTSFSINGLENFPYDPPTCKYISISKCEFSSNATVTIYGVTSGSVVNNIFRNSTTTALQFDSISGSTIPNINGVAVNNNTFYNITSVNSYCIALQAFSDVNNFKILNNIFQSCNGSIYFYILDDTGASEGPEASDILIDYNIDYNASDIYLSYPGFTSLLSPNSIHNTDPLLTDPVNGDFTLQSDSPCVNRGIDNSTDPSVPTDDFIGTIRPNSIHTDFGAYEYIFPVPPVPPPHPPVSVFPMYAPENPSSGQTYTDQFGNQYTYNSSLNQWSKYNPILNISIPYAVPVYDPGYRLQDEDLNVSFCAQGLTWPLGVAYFYTPNSVEYEIDFFNTDGRLVSYGNADRIPEIVTQGVYRANFIVGDDWPTGFYQILWKYQTSANSSIETISKIFQVTTGGYISNIFEYHYCNNDLVGNFVVLPEVYRDISGSFAILPPYFDLPAQFVIV
jgi:hypothetical protein